MKKDKIKIYTLEITLSAILFFALFVPNILSRISLAILMTIFMIITVKVIKKRNVYSIYKKQVEILMFSFAIIYLAIFYLMGLYFGFYKSTITFSGWSLIRYIIPTAIIIVTSEIIRSIFVSQNAKYSKAIIFIAMVLIDVILYSGIYNISSADDFLTLMGFITFASIACNLLYNYISPKFGSRAIIIYRCLTILYVYIIPFIPDVYTFFRAFLRMLYPYMIYLIIEYMYTKKNSENITQNKKRNIILRIILVVLMVMLIMLISCQYRFGILVIGSGSMTGTVNKGDAIIFESYHNQKIVEGQIIIFEKGDMQLVHRVVDVKNVNGEKRYFTKGDANQDIDDGYITEEQIIGVYRFKLKYIGYPTLWFNDIFNH